MTEQLSEDVQGMIQAASGYAEHLAEMIAESEQQTQRWVPANECMVQFFPLTQEAVTLGSDRWYTTQAAWHAKDEAGHSYQHGLDHESRIRLVRYNTQLRYLFVHSDHFVDELVLAGESFRALVRHAFSDGRLVSSNSLSWPGVGLTRNDFAYDGEYLIEQRIRYGEIDQLAGTISSNSLERFHRLQWDDSVPKKKLMHVTSSVGELLYVGYHYRSLGQRTDKPIVAFTLDVDDLGDESSGDGLVGQCYSLEMTADFDWEFDRVLFCLPDAVSRVTQESDVCDTRLEVGGSPVDSLNALTAITEQGGTWAWIDAEQEDAANLLSEASQHGLKTLLSINDASGVFIRQSINGTLLECVSLVLCNLKQLDATRTAATVLAIREELSSTTSGARVIVPFDPSSRSDLIDYLARTGADGVYIDRADLCQLITLLNLVGLHSYRSVPLSVGSDHLLVET